MHVLSSFDKTPEHACFPRVRDAARHGTLLPPAQLVIHTYAHIHTYIHTYIHTGTRVSPEHRGHNRNCERRRYKTTLTQSDRLPVTPNCVALGRFGIGRRGETTKTRSSS